ncbi:DUF418 domain-containing protein [Massilia sp. S19_KUP03_FR1]|uniref:DUF418 domain-containing protein n=1 Tax=Massilia sp. S19_KUP03_FR1 TaxID=3025503 RepID=UPI002FCDDA46
MASPATTDAGAGRIVALDVIRGVAVLGILAVNAEAFAGPMAALHDMLAWPFPHQGATAWSYWLVDVFFREKCVSLFSMLFGVSVFLVGGERADQARGRLLRRRLAVLLGFAMLHGFGLWWGDILSLYAMSGAILYGCRSWQPRNLLAVGLALYGGMAVLLVPATPDAAQAAEAAAAISQARASWSGAYRVNTASYTEMLRWYPFAIPATLGLMMVGLALFKSGLLAGRAAPRRCRMLLAGGAAALLVQAIWSWHEVILLRPLWRSAFIATVLAPLIALGYACGLILLVQSRAGPWLAPLSAAGRMAFTNYLAQSLIMTTVFYGGRGALMGQVDRPALWAIVIAIWVLQLVWSTQWLARFHYGPLEWAWRCLTMGHQVALRRRRVP